MALTEKILENPQFKDGYVHGTLDVQTEEERHHLAKEIEKNKRIELAEKRAEEAAAQEELEEAEAERKE